MSSAQKKPERSLLLTEIEVAGQLAVCRATVARLRESRALPWVKILGSVRYRRSDVETFIRRHRFAGLPPPDPGRLVASDRAARAAVRAELRAELAEAG